jgi:lipopolysaccharide export system permease protein
MKILDRYLLSIFVSASALVMVTFVALFTVMDLSSRIGRILSLKNVDTWSFLLRYYLVRLPTFFHLVLPAVTLFASMFTVIQLQKTNELLPMVTSGVSIRRLSLIFIASALVCSILMGILDEFVLPNLRNAVGETDDILISDKPLRDREAWDSRTHIYIREYDRLAKEMREITLIRYRPNGRFEEIITAKSAKWDPAAKRWVIRAGFRFPHKEDGGPELDPVPGGRPQPRKIAIPPEGLAYEMEIRPEDFQKRFSLSGRSFRLAELLDSIEKYPYAPPFRMHLHSKFATLLSPIILLFLGLPFVTGTEHRSFFRGIGFCLLLTIAFYAVTFVFFEAGIHGNGPPPHVAVWAPTIFFGLLGLAGFLRMRS